MIEIKVYGEPATQGPKRHVGNGVMVESSKKLKPWREAVKWAALETRQKIRPDTPICIDVTFTLAKPKSAPKKRRTWPLSKDLDKLLRSTFDALTDSGVWDDDSRVVAATAIKSYPGEGLRALDSPGAWIRIMEVVDNE